MCGRFSQISNIDVLREKLGLKDTKLLFEPNYNIGPGQSAYGFDKNKVIEQFQWGFSLWSDKNNKIKPINSKIESIHEKNMFKDAYQHNRCIIYADHYYEWVLEVNEKQPYCIHLPQNSPMYFAGIFQPIEVNGEITKTFSILTQNASKFLKNIHHRMPVILNETQLFSYLNKDIKDSTFTLNSQKYCEDLTFNAYPVSKKMSSIKFNSHECIQKITIEKFLDLSHFF